MNFKTRYGMVVYTDPNPNPKDALVKYKGRNAIDAGAFYAPYIPLQMFPSLTERMKLKRAADSRRWWMRLVEGCKPALVFLNALRATFNRRR